MLDNKLKLELLAKKNNLEILINITKSFPDPNYVPPTPQEGVVVHDPGPETITDTDDSLISELLKVVQIISGDYTGDASVDLPTIKQNIESSSNYSGNALFKAGTNIEYSTLVDLFNLAPESLYWFIDSNDVDYVKRLIFNLSNIIYSGGIPNVNLTNIFDEFFDLSVSTDDIYGLCLENKNFNKDVIWNSDRTVFIINRKVKKVGFRLFMTEGTISVDDAIELAKTQLPNSSTTEELISFLTANR